MLVYSPVFIVMKITVESMKPGYISSCRIRLDNKNDNSMFPVLKETGLYSASQQHLHDYTGTHWNILSLSNKQLMDKQMALSVVCPMSHTVFVLGRELCRLYRLTSPLSVVPEEQMRNRSWPYVTKLMKRFMFL